MRSNFDLLDFEAARRESEGAGGMAGWALLALALGAGSALLFAPVEGARTRKVVKGRLRDLRGGAGVALERVQRELGRREARRRRRERRLSALIGLAAGAGLAALLLPESGPDLRRHISDAVRGRKGEVDQDAAATAAAGQREPLEVTE